LRFKKFSNSFHTSFHFFAAPAMPLAAF
jgi:hypothetical protein